MGLLQAVVRALATLLLTTHRALAIPATTPAGIDNVLDSQVLGGISTTHPTNYQPPTFNATLLSDDERATLTTPYFIHNATLNETHKCYEGKAFGKSKRAITRNCLSAIMSLPSDHEAGIFHRAGVSDSYRLPYPVFAPGPPMPRPPFCVITIDIAAGTNERSSWGTINQRTQNLIQACAVGMYPEGRTGGETTVGENHRISIRVERADVVPKPPEDGEDRDGGEALGGFENVQYGENAGVSVS